jgi:hypothetical protein
MIAPIRKKTAQGLIDRTTSSEKRYLNVGMPESLLQARTRRRPEIKASFRFD